MYIIDNLYEYDEMEGVDNQINTNTTAISWKQKCSKLERLMEKEVSKWWELTTLTCYIEVNRVPRGLRIFTIPTYENHILAS
mgnify:CR=1 FL=1